MKPSKKRSIYEAMKRGERLTLWSSLQKYRLASLSQRIGELRDDPEVTETIISERVKGHSHHRYYILS